MKDAEKFVNDWGLELPGGTRFFGSPDWYRKRGLHYPPRDEQERRKAVFYAMAPENEPERAPDPDDHPQRTVKMMLTPYVEMFNDRSQRPEKPTAERIAKLLHWQGDLSDGTAAIEKILAEYPRSIEIENGQINFVWSRRETYALMLVLSYHGLVPFYPADGFKAHPEPTKSLTSFLVESCNHKGRFVPRERFLSSTRPQTGKTLGDTVEEINAVLGLPIIPDEYIERLDGM